MRQLDTLVHRAHTGPSVRILEPDFSLLSRIRQELSSSLSQHEAELLALIGVANFLTCHTVVQHERSAGRLILPQEKVDSAAQVIGSLGIQCKRADFDVRLRQNTVEGTDHEVTFVPRHSGGDRGIIYFGIDQELVTGAQMAERHGEHDLMARLFGYPDCCRQSFSAGAGKSFDRTADCIPDVGPFPRDMNPLLQYFCGLTFLFHFPCSPRCQTSQEISRRRRSYYSRLAPTLQELESLGAGIALYGPRLGIALVTAYTQVSEGLFRAEEITTRGATLRQWVGDADGTLEIRLRSHRHLEIGSHTFHDDDGFGAKFT